jgi:hypothetical protein
MSCHYSRLIRLKILDAEMHRRRLHRADPRDLVHGGEELRFGRVMQHEHERGDFPCLRFGLDHRRNPNLPRGEHARDIGEDAGTVDNEET